MKRHNDLIADLVSRFIVAKGDLVDAQNEIAYCRMQLKKLVGQGKREGFTVYKVKPTYVHGFERSGFTAMRGTTKR